MLLKKDLIFPEKDNVMGLPLSQTKDFPREITVERVAEAIQNLRQDLWRTHLERVPVSFF